MVGIDGWRRGWVGVTLLEGRFADAWIAEDAAGAILRSGDAAVIAVDIPIGLPVSGRRACDLAAKRLLGRHASRVFLAPPRDVLNCEPYGAANDHSRERFGFGISRQSYALRGKILEVDGLADERLREVHPELAFMVMAGAVLESKKTWAGVSARRAALVAAGIEIPGEIGPAGRVPVDDVLDAAAAAWSAQRVARDEAQVVPELPDLDERGKPMAIWF